MRAISEKCEEGNTMWACATLDGKKIYNLSDTADEAIQKSEELAKKGIITIVIRV